MSNGGTKIEWTNATLNSVRGCSPVSEGCANCYAQLQAIRQAKHGQAYDGLVQIGRRGPEWTGALSFDEKALHQPRRWKKGRRVFVNSMGDLFHEDVPEDFIQRQFDVMNSCPQHQFQILTKRSERLVEVAPRLTFTGNIWMGVSIENDRWVSRANDLRRVPAAIRFISAEPLLGPLDNLSLDGISWLIAGGESGSRCRPMDLAWARSLRDRCVDAHVPFFLKQLGGFPSKRGGEGAVLDGRLWNEFPPVCSRGGGES